MARSCSRFVWCVLWWVAMPSPADEAAALASGAEAPDAGAAADAAGDRGGPAGRGAAGAAAGVVGGLYPLFCSKRWQ